MAAGRIRHRLDLALPGFVVGLFAGIVAGGLAAVVGQPAGWALVSALTLGLPLGLLGGGYGVLVGTGMFRPGVFAPAALYWLIGFPLARLIHEAGTRLVLVGKIGLPEDPLGFLAYQAIVSAGFALGFLWLHERVAPQWWRRVADRNPLAEQVFARYAAHSQALWEARQARLAQRRARGANR